MTVYYHNRDLDGFASGAIVKRKYPNAKFVGYDYGQPFEQTPGEPVIMVDVSLPMKTMLKVAQASDFQFTWIDHHKSAINECHDFFEGMKVPFAALLQDGIAACEGAWHYLHAPEPLPPAVLLLGEYDTWRNKDEKRWNDLILPFQYGMRLICNSLETFPMVLLEHNSLSVQMIDSIVRQGKLILDYEAQKSEMQCRLNAFEMEFEGLRAICLNTADKNSNTFNSVYDEAKHDVMMPFQYNGKFWTVSMYTTKDSVDCSVIAKSKGGGGHRKAAGFQVNDITEVFPMATVPFE